MAIAKRTQILLKTSGGISLLMMVSLSSVTLEKHSPRKLGSSAGIHEHVAERRHRALVRHTTDVKKVKAVIKRYGPRKNECPQGLASLIVKESREAGVDPLFVTAVVKSESTFRTKSLSNRNARGLMQITPITEREVLPGISLAGLEGQDLHDPQYNLRLGINYIKQLEGQFKGDRRMALIAYNWGPGNVRKALNGRKTVPEQSVLYARKIIENHRDWSLNGAELLG